MFMKKKTQKTNNFYVDGFVLSVPEKNLKTYKKMAVAAGKVWRKYGALDYKECVGDDMNPNMGGEKILTFPKLAKVKEGEVVVFSYIVFSSKKHRDDVNKKVMAEMEEYAKKHPEKMKIPFDPKRMAYGGFKTIVSE